MQKPNFCIAALAVCCGVHLNMCLPVRVFRTCGQLSFALVEYRVIAEIRIVHNFLWDSRSINSHMHACMVGSVSWVHVC